MGDDLKSPVPRMLLMLEFRSTEEEPETDGAGLLYKLVDVVSKGTPSRMSRRFGRVARGSVIFNPSMYLIWRIF